MRLAWFAFALVGLSACSVQMGSAGDPPDPSDTPPSHEPQKTELPPTPPSKPPPTPPIEEEEEEEPAQVDEGVHAEVVYVLMNDRDGGLWYCTGTLVAARTVVTAAHCLQPTKFIAYQVVAPLVTGKPRVSASNPKSFGGHFDDVANPDIGFLTLNQAIELPRYAQLTDVVADVEANKDVQGVAVVRTEQHPYAPVAPSGAMKVTSTVKFGYEHGFGTPYFSKGGDSGAGLFLVENGKTTHKLIGVARQPEPDRDLDHFTRIDAEFLTWFAANK